jgi:hypothetical protein
LHHGGDRLSIALNIRTVCGNVGDRKQRDELVHDSGFVLPAPLPRGLCSGVGRCKSLGGEPSREYAQQKDAPFHTVQYLTSAKRLTYLRLS